MPTDLSRLFRPRSIAVVGASSTVDSPGHDYVQSLVDFAFPGPVYPVSRRAEPVAGIESYPSLSDVPGEVDLVISCIPASGVLALVDEAAARGVRFLHLFTGRFSETGDASAAALEAELAQKVEAAGIRMLGPNCMGLYVPGSGIAFRPDLPRQQGNVAFLSQSGNNAVEVIVRGSARGLAFGKVVNYGNGVDLTPGEMLAYLAEDDETAVIGAYVEGVPDGRGFFEGLRAAAQRKPVIIHKAGRTSAGARAAASHTAALAGANAIWSAALRQAGAVQVRSQEDLVDAMLVASKLLGGARRLHGRRIAVVGGGGGRSVQSADACEEAGFAVPPLPEALRDKVRERAPGLADWIANPVDQSILAGSGLSSNRLLEMMLASGAYDAGICNVGEDWFFGRPEAEERLSHACTRMREVIQASDRPVAVVLGPTETRVDWQRALIDRIRDELTDAGLAVFPTVERAAAAMGRLA